MNWNQLLGMPELAAAHGGPIDGLIGWIHVFMLILFVGWGGFFLYCLVRFRRSRNPVADYTGVTSPASKYAEIGVAIVEAIILVGFSIPLWAARVDDLPARDAKRSSSRLRASSSPGTCTMPGPTGNSAAPTSSCSISSRIRSDSIAPIPPALTTSRRSISFICPSTGRSS